MGYILIVIGIVCIIAGIFVLQKPAVATSSNNEDGIQIAEKETNRDSQKEELTEAEKKGRDFEKYVVSRFPKKYYSIKEWRSDKCVNGHYAESNTYPDLEMTLQLGKSEYPFAVECKWRHEFSDKGYIQWCEDSQLDRYRQYASDKALPVFIIIGVGGEPSSPEYVYCVPLKAMKYSDVKKSYLEGFIHDKSKEFYYYAKEDELK